jgi:hypothetical protein
VAWILLVVLVPVPAIALTPLRCHEAFGRREAGNINR